MVPDILVYKVDNQMPEDDTSAGTGLGLMRGGETELVGLSLSRWTLK